MTNYLISIKVNEERKNLKAEITRLYGNNIDFQKKIVDEIMVANENVIRKNQLEKANARFNSLNWMIQWDNPENEEIQIIDNLNNALILLRTTIRDEDYDLTIAKKLMDLDVEKIFKNAEKLKSKGEPRVSRYFKERENHRAMFEAFEEMNKYRQASQTIKNEERMKTILRDEKIPEKLNKCLFGRDYAAKNVQQNVIFEIKELDSRYTDERSTKELNEIREKLVPVFLNCLIEIYDKYNYFDEG